MAIGVFDSGVGGLSIHRALVDTLPQADFIYLADQAHTPYGDRSGEEIVDLTRAGCETLFDAGARHLDDLLARLVAIGRIGLVGQVDEIGLRQAVDERVVDGQAAHAGIEYADSHEVEIRDEGKGKSAPVRRVPINYTLLPLAVNSASGIDCDKVFRSIHDQSIA